MVGGASALRAGVLIDAAVLASPPQLAQWGQRLELLQARLALPNVTTDRRGWTLGDCPMVVLVATQESPQ